MLFQYSATNSLLKLVFTTLLKLHYFLQKNINYRIYPYIARYESKFDIYIFMLIINYMM